jgi:hypothetical protein
MLSQESFWWIQFYRAIRMWTGHETTEALAILGGFNTCVITWRLSSVHELPLPTAVLSNEEGILRVEGKGVNGCDAWQCHCVKYGLGWTVSYRLFSQFCFFVTAKYLNYNYKSPLCDNGKYDHVVFCAARGMSFFKDLLHNVWMSGMATTLIYDPDITFLANSSTKCICSISMWHDDGLIFFWAEKSHISWWYSNN